MKKPLLLVLSLLLAACSGGGSTSAPPEEPTATPAPSTTPTPGTGGHAFIVTGDFESGSYAALPLADPSNSRVDIGAVHGDAVARSFDGRVYVVNRFGADSIQGIDPQRDWATIFQCSVGNGSNPHDIAFAAPDKAYVTRYEEASLAIVDPSVGPGCEGFMRGEIDLTAFADSDGIPEMDQMVIVDGLLFVSLQRLDRNQFFEPAGESFLVVIDTATDTPIDTAPETPGVDPIVLRWTNPLGAGQGLPLHPATGDIIVAQIGSFGIIGDGGIETISPTTFASTGLLITEADIGLNITDFVAVDGRTAWAIGTDETFRNYILQIDTTLRESVRTIFESEAFLPDMELERHSSKIWLTDRTFGAAGIRIFSATDGSGIENAVRSTGLPPTGIIFVD
ncbi:MAG: hypothetical protein VCC00_07930 [Deltaproteobacteria bacterium]